MSPAKQLERQGIEQILSPKQTRRPLPSLLILSFFYGLRFQTREITNGPSLSNGRGKTSMNLLAVIARSSTPALPYSSESLISRMSPRKQNYLRNHFSLLIKGQLDSSIHEKNAKKSRDTAFS